MTKVKYISAEEYQRRQRERERLERQRIKNLPWWKKHGAVVKAIFR